MRSGNRLKFDSSIFRNMAFQSLEELKAEWLNSQDPRPFWEYLGMSEYQFREWMRRRMTQELDT